MIVEILGKKVSERISGSYDPRSAIRMLSAKAEEQINIKASVLKNLQRN